MSQVETPTTKWPDLVNWRNPILREKMERFDFADPPTNPVELYNTLGTLLTELGGLGLAAPQLGLPYRLFVLRAEKILGCFNPIVVDTSEETWKGEEACLSIPGLVLKVTRPQRIRLRYTEPNGNVKTEVFHDLTARIVQHELDHLDGILFTNRVSKLELKLGIERAKRGYVIGDVL